MGKRLEYFHHLVVPDHARDHHYRHRAAKLGSDCSCPGSCRLDRNCYRIRLGFGAIMFGQA